jgi:CBS domain containing-hemolysin-like protein
MPDSDAASRSNEPPRNLPIPVVRPSEVARDSDSWLGRLMRAVFGWKSGSIRADLETVLDAATPSETGFSPTESRMLRNILGLRERRVDDVMVPRADIIAVQHDIILGELVKVFESAAHSRLVVYGETLDDPLGMVHIRDLIAFMTKKAAATVKSAKASRRKQPVAGLDFKAVDLSQPLSSIRIMRQLIYVPPSMPAIDLLARMQATRIHLALVIDEYGGTEGLVSIEDIVEQIVGEIEDEHDEASIHTIVRQFDGSYLADGRANLEEVLTAIGPEFDIGDAGQDIDTLNGYVVMRIGRVPVRGELVSGPGRFEFEILDADPRRVKKIRIFRSKKAREVPSHDTASDAASTSEATPVAEPRATEAPREIPSSKDDHH